MNSLIIITLYIVFTIMYGFVELLIRDRLRIK